MRTATIYSIVDSVTRETRYVGSTLLPFYRRRAGKYSKPVERWMKACTTEFCVLETCSAVDRAAREQHWIDKLRSEGAILLNKVIAQAPLHAHETEPIKAMHPSESESARRDRNEARLNYRTTTAIRAKLAWLVEDEGTSANDMLDLLIEGEWESRQEQRRIAEHKRNKPRSA